MLCQSSGPLRQTSSDDIGLGQGTHEERLGQRAQDVRFDQYEPVMAEQAAPDTGMPSAIIVGFLRFEDDGIGRSRKRDLPIDFVECMSDGLGNGHLFDGVALLFPIERDRSKRPGIVQPSSVIDLSEIMILRGEPENGHDRGIEAIGQPSSRPNHRYDLVDDKQRTTEESGLLSPDHAQGVHIAQAFDVSHCFGGGIQHSIVFEQGVTGSRTRPLIGKRFSLLRQAACGSERMLKEFRGRFLSFEKIEKERRFRIQDTWIDGLCHLAALDATNTMRGLSSVKACPLRPPWKRGLMKPVL